MMIGLKPFLVLITLSGPVKAQDWSSGVAMRALERSSHETLVALIERSDTTLAPFQTDGCSGGLSEAWQRVAGQFPNFSQVHHSSPPWEACCRIHDRAYHDAANVSDSADSFEARLTADLALRSCVISASTDRVDALVEVYDVSPEKIEKAYESIAETMYLAVRIGGAPCSGLPWRWGYGYPTC